MNRILPLMLSSSGIYCSLLHMWPGVWEDCITSISSIKGQSSNKPACSRWLGRTSRQQGYLLYRVWRVRRMAHRARKSSGPFKPYKSGIPTRSLFCTATCCMLVSCLADILPWRWRWYIPLKCQFTYGLPGAIFQQMATFITTTVTTSNPTYFQFIYF
jgi:hypothetical protein